MGGIRDESDKQRASAERVRIYISGLTRSQFQDLTRRLVLYAARLLRGRVSFISAWSRLKLELVTAEPRKRKRYYHGLLDRREFSLPPKKAPFDLCFAERSSES